MKKNARAVARFYERMDLVYRGLWGESLHHGLWIGKGCGREKAIANMKTHLGDLAGLAALPKDARVLDVGCAYGKSARFWEERHHLRVDGVTLSETQARVAREKLRGRVSCGDWHDFPDSKIGGVGENSRAVVFCVETFSHSARADVFLKNLVAVLAPGGRLVLADWACAEKMSGPETFLMRLLAREGALVWRTDADLRAGLEKAGFSIVSHEKRGRDVAPTWPCMALRTVRALSDWRLAAAMLGVLWKRPLLAFTPLLAWLLYRSGALRYGIWLAEKNSP